MKRQLGKESACWLAPHGCVHCRAVGEAGRSFRRGMMLRVIVPNDDPDFACPWGVAWGATTGPAGLVSQQDARRLASFHELWGELHARPRLMASHAEEVAWHKAFAARLPCGTCRDEWRRLLLACPPDWSSPPAYFRWTVAAHNAVNERLGKRVMPLVEAAEIHGYGGQAAGRTADRTGFEPASIDK
jgi:hypothetical protein